MHRELHRGLHSGLRQRPRSEKSHLNFRLLKIKKGINKMWNNIMEKFEKYPSQQKVVKKLLELGLRIDTNNKIYCKDVEINISSLAKSLNTDRRVITSTIKNILKDEELKKIFMNIYPSGPVLTNISNVLGLGVIEIEETT